jgi:Xaa-Pro aminopeptidase
METLQPALKRGRDVWDPIHMPQKEFEGRVEKIQQEMKKESLDVLLLYGNGVNEYAHPSYVSNFVIRMPQGALVILPSNGEPTLIVEGFSRDLPAVKKTTWMKDVRSCADPSQECIKVMQEKSLIPSATGLVGVKEFMPFHQFRFLSDALAKGKIVYGDEMITRLRSRKSERECDQMRRASRIVRKAFEFIGDGLLPSSNEKALEAGIDFLARLEGAEDVRILIGKPSEGAWALRPAEMAPLSKREALIVYIAVAFERYWSEGIRTYLCDHSSSAETLSERLKALYEQILAKMKPGKAVASLHREALDQIKAACLEHIPRYGLGQGIGLSLREFPVIAEDSKDFLERSMCLTLRLATKDPEFGALMTGNTILLSEENQEVLTNS